MAIQDELFKEIIDWTKDPLNKPQNQNKYLYGDGVSYYQELCKILKYVKYLKEYLEENVITKEYLQEQLDALENKLSTQIQAIEDNVQGITVEIGTINQEIADILQQLEAKIESDDYATETTGGTLKQNSETAFLLDEDGKPYAQSKTYLDYNNASDSLFVAKATLEHVLDKETVRTDKVQSLDETHQTQARNNIGAQGKLTAGTNITIENDVISASGEIGVDWSDVSNKPQINGHDLVSGDNSLSSLGIQPEGDYATNTALQEGLETKQPVGDYLVQDDLTDYVKNTDYATNDKGGIFKTANSTFVDSTGMIYATPLTITQYTNYSNYNFISKGTLENIKNNYVKQALVDNDITLTDEEKLAFETWMGLSENYLTYYNETPYQVTGDYNPAHKKYVDENLASKQDTLISGTTIKTINNETLLGEGNIVIEAGRFYGVDFTNQVLYQTGYGGNFNVTYTIPVDGVAFIWGVGNNGTAVVRVDDIQLTTLPTNGNLIPSGGAKLSLPVKANTQIKFTGGGQYASYYLDVYGLK